MLRSDICYFSDAYIIVKGTTGLEFQITDTTLCVPVVTLSKKQNKKKDEILLEQLRSGFKRTVK